MISRFRSTGKVLSRSVHIYSGKKLRYIANEYFRQKMGFLQIVPNNRGCKYWASINLLITASIFNNALLSKVHMKDDQTVDSIEMLCSLKS
jgi:hypothetical protein